MVPQFQSNATLVFGPFEVNAAAGQLRKNGIRIRLSGQPFQILLALLSRPGEVITSEQLRQQIWADGTFVDFEHGLHAAVNKLRRALGDSAENPRYIETVPGRGYRFIGSLEPRRAPIPMVVGAAQPSAAASAAARQPASFRWPVAAACLLLLAVTVGAVFYFHSAPAEERVFSLQIDAPEGSEFSYGTQFFGLSLSPDGKTAAFVADSHGKPALWIRPLAASTAHLLAGTEEAGFPFWSPDSRSIAFFAQGKLQRVELSGGAPQTICPWPQGAGGTWDASGRIVFAGWSSGLYQVPASGGQPLPLTTLDTARGETFHYWPQMLPGGRFLYFVGAASRELGGVYVSSLQHPGQRVRVLEAQTNALYIPRSNGSPEKGYLLWLRGPELVAQEFDASALKLSGTPHRVAGPVARVAVHGQMEVAVSSTGVLLYNASNPLRRLAWLDRAGRPLGNVGDAAETGFFRLSPDGRRVAVSRVGADGADIWIMDVDRGIPTRFSSRPGANIYPVWSSDGQTVLFASGGPLNLFHKGASGAGREERLTQSPNPQLPNDSSRDGRFLLYEEDTPNGDRQALRVLALSPGATARPYHTSPFNEYMGRISPDSRWAAYESDESGRYEVYVDAFPEPRGKVRISTGGGIRPQWSASGRELFFVSADFKLMSVAVKPGAESLAPSMPRELFAVPAQDTNTYDVAPDGRFLVLLPEPAIHPLTVLVNWPSLLNAGS